MFVLYINKLHLCLHLISSRVSYYTTVYNSKVKRDSAFLKAHTHTRTNTQTYTQHSGHLHRTVSNISWDLQGSAFAFSLT